MISSRAESSQLGLTRVRFFLSSTRALKSRLVSITTSCFLTGSQHASARNFHLSVYSSWWSLSHQLESWLTDPAACLTRATSLSATSMSHVLVGNLNIHFMTHKYARNPIETLSTFIYELHTPEYTIRTQHQWRRAMETDVDNRDLSLGFFHSFQNRAHERIRDKKSCLFFEEIIFIRSRSAWFQGASFLKCFYVFIICANTARHLRHREGTFCPIPLGALLSRLRLKP